MPLFRSLRSKSSLKSSSASVLSDKDDTDFAPRSGSQKAYGSVRGGGGGHDGSSVNRTSHKHALSSAGTGGDGVPAAKQVSMPASQSLASMQSFQQPGLMSTMSSTNDTSFNGSAASQNKPRPSELFAGKGVQWDSVKLAGPGASPAGQSRATTNNTEDLQTFLKQRRQWKPTFITEESAPRQSQPTDLNKLSFMSHDNELQSRGLMSFEDLDKSHQRKQKLLSDNPLGTSSIFDEAETSKAGQRRAASSANSTFAVPSDVPKRRNASVKATRKAVQGSQDEIMQNASGPAAAGGKPITAAGAPMAPSRSTSAQLVPKDLAASTGAATTKTNGTTQATDPSAPPDIQQLQPPITSHPGALAVATSASPHSTAASDQQPTTPAIRQSTDRSSGFVTADNSRPQSVQGQVPMDASPGEAAQEAAVPPSAHEATLPTPIAEEPSTPRANVPKHPLVAAGEATPIRSG